MPATLRRAALVILAALALVLAGPARGEITFLDETFPVDAARPAVGHWIGEITPPEGAPGMFVSMRVQGGGEEPWSATVLFLQAMALHTVVEDVTVSEDGRDIGFTLPAGTVGLRFEGRIDEAGQRLAGAVGRVIEGEPEADTAALLLARTPRAEDLPALEAFSGAIEIQGVGEMDMTVVLAETPGGNLVGHLDVPAQSLRAFPLVNISRDETGLIRATLPVPVPANLEVSKVDDGARLEGRFKQAAFDLALDFSRDEAYAYREIPRPQQPQPPYPYEVRDVVATHPDGFDLAGSLTVPDRELFGPGPFPAVVLISGSGQQDRDESLLGHKPFLVIADHLTRHGIAVMRYDDRGVGGSGGGTTLETATSHDFATDALAVLQRLHDEPDIDARHIGLLGHSEGGLIAPMVGQLTDEVAFMVLLAGPGVRGRDLLPLQMKLAMTATGGDAVVAEQFRLQMLEAIDLVLDGADDETVRETLRAAARTQARLMGMSDDEEMLDEYRGQFVDGQVGMLTMPWMKFFLDYDPAPALRETTCPVLAVNGTKDLQVWHEQNLDEIQRVMTAAGRDVTIIRYEGLNHLFQPAGTGSGVEYGTIEITIDERVLGDIVEWIRTHTRSENVTPKPERFGPGPKVVK